MELLSILIPIFATAFCLIRFKDELTYQEIALMITIPIVLSIGVRLICFSTMETDTQYKGYYYTKAYYTEYWSSWKEETCTRTYTCNCTTDSKGTQSCQTCTETYDCSYCDKNQAKWTAIDNNGKEHSITQEYYNYLKKKWKSPETFVELNRNIVYENGCGQDGDQYMIEWNKDPNTLDSYTIESSYVNKTVNAGSVFSYNDLDEATVKKHGIFNYPVINNGYQKTALGLKLGVYDSTDLHQSMEYFNGFYGKERKIRSYVLFFVDKPSSIALKQREHWKNGNQNEIDICIGVDKKLNVQWVYVFSWSENKLITTIIKDRIYNMKRLKKGFGNDIVNILIDETKNFHYREMKRDFEYITIELPMASIILIYIVTIISTIAICYWSIKNEFTKNY